VQRTIDAFFFDATELRETARRHRDGYVSAQPFPHVALHDLVPADALRPVIAEFPAPGALPGKHNDKPYEKKRSYRDEATLGPHTRQLISQLNSSLFLQFLEELTGIAGLVPDPHLAGGGLHQIERGGFLSIHADFNKLNRLGLDRRLNLLLYLNDDWDESWGGHLELWSRDMARCESRIAPTLGTSVIFNTVSDAFHGHPEPLACPADRTRMSLALYYYSHGRPDAEVRAQHSTLWQRRPGESADEIPSRRIVRPALRRIARRMTGGGR
jgi:Rps23 Pro-64 3,4-dihydroxylase Tpa1-like proline 4-hydroxylase